MHDAPVAIDGRVDDRLTPERGPLFGGGDEPADDDPNLFVGIAALDDALDRHTAHRVGGDAGDGHPALDEVFEHRSVPLAGRARVPEHEGPDGAAVDRGNRGELEEPPGVDEAVLGQVRLDGG